MAPASEAQPQPAAGSVSMGCCSQCSVSGVAQGGWWAGGLASGPQCSDLEGFEKLAVSGARGWRGGAGLWLAGGFLTTRVRDGARDKAAIYLPHRLRDDLAWAMNGRADGRGEWMVGEGGQDGKVLLRDVLPGRLSIKGARCPEG